LTEAVEKPRPKAPFRAMGQSVPLSVMCACSFVGLRLFTSLSTGVACSGKDAAPFPADDRH
jgi:hypothetical protein